ncbi:pilin [Thalassotalea sp. ND16A]|uniref:pilin n=1 Tax=Thalassotalea sp. ND16A TaxID=1535422 RepID=UPI00051A4E89|nr:prepilin-type N-terminal cleavage/methylation domain-containing protein [Thalassotalea sp. ND16A]KGK01150.1 hypothetical protein ND16A_3012 [Thalassotalea sp. ND16A]
MKNLNGFTLIELLIVVTILSVLASIAFPSYIHYSDKAKFATVVSAAAPVRTSIDICVQAKSLPDCSKLNVNSKWMHNEFISTIAITGTSSKIVVKTTPKNIGNITNLDTYILTGNVDSKDSLVWDDDASGCKISRLC